MAAKMPEEDPFKFLERESRAFDKDAEIDRVMQSFKLNPYEVMGILPGKTAAEIKKLYRAKSLLIHPDKTPNPQAADAFGHLEKASKELSDEKRLAYFDDVYAGARRVIMREKKWNLDSHELREHEFLVVLWPAKVRDILIEDAQRSELQRKAQMREEGRQQRMEDEARAEKAQKREFQNAWEAQQESRVRNWRDFVKTSEVTKGSYFYKGPPEKGSAVKPAAPKPAASNAAGNRPGAKKIEKTGPQSGVQKTRVINGKKLKVLG